MADNPHTPTWKEARGELLGVVAAPRAVAASAQVWIASAVLGALRQASNDSLRAPWRDRGEAKNAAGDLQGAFGEILIAALLEHELPEAAVTFDPFRWEGAGDDVDARVDLHGHEFLVETKCHLDKPGKRLFLINAEAALRSRARGARSFIPVISSIGAAVALLGRPIPITHVTTWRIRSWSYGDPARSASLRDVSKKYFGRDYRELQRDLAAIPPVVTESELGALEERVHDRFPQLHASPTPIGRTPSGAVAQLIALAT